MHAFVSWRSYRQAFVFLCLFSMACGFTSISAQNPSNGIAASALAATFGNERPQSITLTGQVTFRSGSGPEQGTVKLVADADGASRAFFSLQSGDLSEEQWDDSHRRQCRFTAKGTTDSRLTPNCWMSAPWFLPQMSLLKPDSALNRQDLGLLNEEGASQRVLVSQRLPDAKFRKPADATAAAGWSETRMRLDPTTLLPRSLAYTITVDSRSSTAIKVRVEFSDYRNESGILIPHHIERFFNGTLQADILIDSVTVK